MAFRRFTPRLRKTPLNQRFQEEAPRSQPPPYLDDWCRLRCRGSPTKSLRITDKETTRIQGVQRNSLKDFLRCTRRRNVTRGLSLIHLTCSRSFQGPTPTISRDWLQWPRGSRACHC